jgi:hypothetical protein
VNESIRERATERTQMMTQMSQTTKTEEQYRRVAGEPTPDIAERERLQMLVGELLSENQKLRFDNEGLRAKVALVEQKAQVAERGLKDATKWAGMLL